MSIECSHRSVTVNRQHKPNGQMSTDTSTRPFHHVDMKSTFGIDMFQNGQTVDSIPVHLTRPHLLNVDFRSTLKVLSKRPDTTSSVFTITKSITTCPFTDITLLLCSRCGGTFNFDMKSTVGSFVFATMPRARCRLCVAIASPLMCSCCCVLCLADWRGFSQC